MPNLIIKRRSFLSSLFAIFLFSRCKKETVKPTASSKAIVADQPATEPPLGSYSITEYDSNLYPQPDFAKQIFGYTDKISYFPGESLSLYLTGPTSSSQLIQMKDANNNIAFSVTAPLETQQTKSAKPWVSGCMFNETATIRLPDNLKSGMYYWPGTNPIAVKNKTTNYDITIVFSSNTDNAYNFGGGKGLYNPGTSRATVVSFSRFLQDRNDYDSAFFSWMNLQAYDSNYISDADLDDYDNIKKAKIVILAGHSEYWTRQARLNIDKFVETGKNLLILAGNTMWWQVRYNKTENSMICYKDKWDDPLGNTIYSTINWNNPILNYPIINSTGTDFSLGGYGNILPDRWNGYKIINENSPLFEGTGLKNGDILKNPTYEYDGAPVIKLIEPGSEELPVIDNSKLNFYKIELLGYDFAVQAIDANSKGLGTFIVFKKTNTSGTVVNVASENWCSKTGIYGKDKEKIQTITKNMIDKSLNNHSLFSDNI